VVEAIEVEDFMNHAHTRVELKHRINFITGINGGP
jgi:recombinational DNA repair ATPase RecF